jgi:hypothetical protein
MVSHRLPTSNQGVNLVMAFLDKQLFTFQQLKTILWLTHVFFWLQGIMMPNPRHQVVGQRSLHACFCTQRLMNKFEA